ncbi:MAG: glycosyltransferase family 39 protein [Chloroflexota bacterium]
MDQSVSKNRVHKPVAANLLVGVLMLLAVAVRVIGYDWDDLYHLHPDERYMVWVATTIEFPETMNQALDPRESSLNPYYWPKDADSVGIVTPQNQPRDYAYGHWPLYLTVLAQKGASVIGDQMRGHVSPTGLIGTLANVGDRIEYDHFLIVGRVLSALIDAGTCWLIFLISRRLFGWKLAALSLLASSAIAIHVQQSHFFVSDTFLSFAVTLSVYYLIRYAESQRFSDMMWAGAAIGLAVGAKFSAIMILIATFIAVYQIPKKIKATQKSSDSKLGSNTFLLILGLLAAALIIFFVTNPFAILDTTCPVTVGGNQIPIIGLTIPRISLGSCYLKNISTQSAMVRGSPYIPFTLQYADTTPYWYYVDQMARWAVGLLPSMLMFLSIFLVLVESLLGRAKRGIVIILAWILPYWLITGAFQVKFLRYLMPILPLTVPIVIYAGSRVFSMFRRKSLWSNIARIVTTGAVILAVASMWVRTLSIANMYLLEPHPWITASSWLLENVPENSTLVTEHWDHSLPLNLHDLDNQRSRVSTVKLSIDWFRVEDRHFPDSSRDSLESAADTLSQADYLVLASNRVYGSITAHPERYPEAAAYYRLLFDGDIGFRMVFSASRFPSVARVQFVNDPFTKVGLAAPALTTTEENRFVIDLGSLDESATVYDHPIVLVFENVGKLASDEISSRIANEAAN